MAEYINTHSGKYSLFSPVVLKHYSCMQIISFWNYKYLKGTNEVDRQYFQQAVLLCLLRALYYAGICSYAAYIMLCPKLCWHNSPRPSVINKKSCGDYVPHVSSLNLPMMQTFSYLQESLRCTHTDIQTWPRTTHLQLKLAQFLWPNQYKCGESMQVLSSANQTGSQD